LEQRLLGAQSTEINQDVEFSKLLCFRFSFIHDRLHEIFGAACLGLKFIVEKEKAVPKS
jgi:hypothetical protein